MNFETFNFDSLMSAENNPFGEHKQSSYTDDRFFKLTKDNEQNGAAIIRFLPDGDKKLFREMYRISVNTENKGVKRFYSEWSPQNIGLKDPFQEHWAKLWNGGHKEEARKFARSTRYVCNILVVNDLANPANNGKIFLLDVSKTLKDRLSSFMFPTEQDIALGKKPVALFNPMVGQNFVLKCRKGTNGFINYDSSEPQPQITAAFSSPEEAMDAILNKCYRLSLFDNPEMYPSEEVLKEKLDYVLFRDTQSQPEKNEVVDVSSSNIPPRPQPIGEPLNQQSDIDAFLNSV